MPKYPPKRSSRVLGILFFCLLIIAASAAGLWFWKNRQESPLKATVSRPVTTAPTPAPVSTPQADKQPAQEPAALIGHQTIEKDPALRDLMAERKAKYGIDKGVDFIAAPDEAIEVGGITVPMSEIIDKIRLKRGDILEKSIAGKRARAEIEAELKTVLARLREAEKRARDKDPSLRARAQADIVELTAEAERLKLELEGLTKALNPDAPVELYGIHVVRPSDNIWNIHFNFLKDLFGHKGIAMSPLADEPTANGTSSGVGKLLKFSENMVAIYNVRERRLEARLDLITPDSKVVVFNFSKVFAMLDQIDYENINHIQFDGETIWIPAVQ